ncbi:hypothetical protein ENUP19_0131G0001 [Entamoeba nuttalli]|uniref:Uncharacterized protein n=1 Tax=Entamoeba nuttalli TaxID=412467 RepID=A0ABQ0DJT2_9EUKA
MSVETIQNPSNTMEEESTKENSSITTIPQSPNQINHVFITTTTK